MGNGTETTVPDTVAFTGTTIGSVELEVEEEADEESDSEEASDEDDVVVGVGVYEDVSTAFGVQVEVGAA